MLGVLLKKRLHELFRSFFKNLKTNQRRSKGAIVGMFLLFGTIFLILGFSFFGMSAMVGDEIIGKGKDWLFFSILGSMSILVGAFGSIFSTYSSLYLSKDNELLLSMPIPPSKILVSRLLCVVVFSGSFSLISWIPACIRYFLFASAFEGEKPSIVFPLLMMILIPIFVSAISCVLGWIVARISLKAKGKSFFTVLASLIFFAVYYYVCFNTVGLITKLIENLEKIEKIFTSWLYPISLLGKGASGDVGAFLLFAAITFVFMAICVLVLLKNYEKILTTAHNSNKSKTNAYSAKRESVFKSCFNREFKHFISSSTYMLNSGLGIFILFGVSIFVIIKPDFILNYASNLSRIMPDVDALPVISVTIICGMVSLNLISAPSVSLEGQTIWILKTMPIDTWTILRSKEALHVVLCAVPAVFSAIVFGFVFEFSPLTIVFMLASVVAFVFFTADFGLVVGTKKAFLDWTNEVVPIKQGSFVLIRMLVNIVSVLFVNGIGFGLLFLNIVGIEAVLALDFAFFLVLTLISRKWLKTKGVKAFDEL